MKWLLLILACFCPVFFLFAYNSGYGYDAYEYLIIARSLDQGHRLYDFIITKSYLLYSATDVLLRLLGGYNHVSVSALIMLLATGVLLSAWYTARIFSERAALIAVVFTAVCCFFMEMNFLEPESWIAIFGLNAFALVTRTQNPKNWRWFGAGVLLGVAMCFKSVAAFYVAGFGAFVGILWLAGRITFWPMVVRGALVLLGFAVPLLLSAWYFYATNRLDEHLEWSYVYPFGGYPAHTLFLTKFFIKLGWLLLLVLVSLAMVLQQPYRSVYQKTPALWLALLLAVFASATLLKTQASHYFFPAAIFLSLHLGFFVDQWITHQGEQRQGIPRRLLVAGSLVGGLAVVSLLVYRPDAAKRLVSVKDYGGEKQVGEIIRQLAGPTGNVLLIDNAMTLYYLSDREPNVPFIHTEMQTTHYIKSHPDTYGRALADTNLKLVVFGNRTSVIDDSTTIHQPANAYALRQLRTGLKTSFKPVNDPRLGLTYWVRK